MSVLQIFRGDELMEEVVLSRAVIGLGRHPQNDVVLDDRSLSRFHARVERRGDKFVVVDCGAQNGVHLNGQRIVGESDLSPDDKITLGRYVAVFRSASASARDTAPAKNTPKALKNGKNGHAHKPAFDELEHHEEEFDGLDVEVSLDEEPADDGATKKARPLGLKRAEPTLVLLYNGMEVSRHAIAERPITVGRSKQADVVISLLGLSRKHAKIQKNGDSIVVEDLGSQNGTWVNNQRINGPRKLKHGDLLNFYDYAVLYLEDGSVDVGFPGAGFQLPEHGDDLASKDTNRAMPQGPAKSHRPPTGRAPVPIADSLVVKAPEGLGSQSELVDLGEGSFLGEEFEAEAKAKGPGLSSSLLEELPVDDDDDGDIKQKTTTDLVDNLDLSADLRAERDEVERAFREAEEFAENATEGELGHFADKTSATHGDTSGGKHWARDEELLTALSNAPDSVLCTLEVQLGGKAYTQMPLSQTVTRVGTDARCELSLPKSSGLMAWHLTLLHLGGSVVLYRAGRAAKIQLGNHDVDMAILKDGDLLDLGKVRIKMRMR